MYDSWLHFFVNSVNDDPGTLKVKIGKDVHTVVSFFKINFLDKLSQDPSYRFSAYFHVRYISDHR